EAESLRAPGDAHARSEDLGTRRNPDRVDVRVLDGDRRGQAQLPQTSCATSTTRSSLRHCSSKESALPWWVLEKPHCGDRQRFSRGTNLAAASMRFLSRSFDSSSPTLVVTSPSTTFLSFGRYLSGSKPPERSSSNSMKKASTSEENIASATVS